MRRHRSYFESRIASACLTALDDTLASHVAAGRSVIDWFASAGGRSAGRVEIQGRDYSGGIVDGTGGGDEADKLALHVEYPGTGYQQRRLLLAPGQFFHGKRYSCTPILSPDYVKLAEAYGIPGWRVRSPAELADVVARATAEPGPVLVEFVIATKEGAWRRIPPV